MRVLDAECALGADRAAPTTHLNRSWVAVMGEGVEVASRRAAEDPDECGLVELRHLRHGGDRAITEFAGRDGPNAPEPLHRECMEELELAVDGYDEQAIGLRDPLATFAKNFVRATPTVMGIPTRSRTSLRRRAPISDGRPEIRRSPPTSRNASSIDIPSTSGVVSRKTSNIDLLAPEYASIRGRTTIACGHSRRA